MRNTHLYPEDDSKHQPNPAVCPCDPVYMTLTDQDGDKEFVVFHSGDGDKLGEAVA